MIIEIEVIIVHQIEVIVDQTKFLVEIKIDDDLDRDQGKNKFRKFNIYFLFSRSDRRSSKHSHSHRSSRSRSHGRRHSKRSRSR